MFRFFLFFVFSIQFSAYAQFKPNVAHHLDEVNVAGIFMANGQADSAIRHYEIALQYFDDVKKVWFDLGELYEQKEAYASAINAYSNGILKGGFSSENIHSEDFKRRFNNPGLLPFTRSLDSLFGVFYTKNFNWEFSLLVWDLCGGDHAVRDMENVFIGEDIAKSAEFQRIMGIVDTTNSLPALLEYLERHPFPKATTLNGDVSSSFWLLVHHILQYEPSIPGVAKLQSYIRQAVFNGEYDVQAYIMTLDYQYINHSPENEKKQLYGMYKMGNQDGKYSYYPAIDNIQSVDKRRAQWHLLPLHIEKKINDWWPDAPEGYDPTTQE